MIRVCDNCKGHLPGRHRHGFVVSRSQVVCSECARPWLGLKVTPSRRHVSPVDRLFSGEQLREAA